MKPQDLVVYSQVSLNKTLMDRRYNHYGHTFGKVRNICRQYGIKHRKIGQWTEFRAPKSRLQMFVEKLHFSLTPYTTSIS